MDWILVSLWIIGVIVIPVLALLYGVSKKNSDLKTAAENAENEKIIEQDRADMRKKLQEEVEKTVKRSAELIQKESEKISQKVLTQIDSY